MSQQQTPFASVELASTLAMGIHSLRGQDALNVLTAFFRPRLTRTLRSLFEPSTPTEPGYFFTQDDTTGYLVLDGTLTWEQAWGIMQGYVGGLTDSISQPDNVYFLTAAFVITDALFKGPAPWPTTLYVGGWSLGGAVGTIMPMFIRQRAPNIGKIYTHTFGAPRIGGPTMTAHLEAASTLTRWMNDNDPVPLLPPRVLDFPAVLPLFGLRGALRADNFIEPAGGVSIDRNGVLTPAINPQAAAASFTASLAQWLLDLDRDENADHFITEYMLRLVAAEAIQTQKGHLDVGARELPIHTPAQAVTAEGRHLAAQINDLQRQQGEPAVVIPKEFLFKPVRLSGTWYVKMGAEILVTVGSKRGARAFARAGNAWLRELQSRAVVSSTALLEQLKAYLEAASTSGSGFAPTMNVLPPS